MSLLKLLSPGFLFCDAEVFEVFSSIFKCWMLDVFEFVNVCVELLYVLTVLKCSVYFFNLGLLKVRQVKN